MFLFFFFFEPFRVNVLTTKQKLNTSFLLSGITFAILSFYLLVLPAYLKDFFSKKKWFVLTEIIWDFWLMINVFVGYFIFFKYSGNHLISLTIVDSLKILFLAALVITIVIVFNYQRILKLNLKNAIELNKKIQKQEEDVKFFYFDSEYKKDSIRLKIDDVILLKSAGNYVEIFYLSNNVLKKHLIRSSLKRIEEKLIEEKSMFKCHRSYIVNINFIQNAEADSFGLKINIKNLDFPVPVSKNYVESLKKRL